MQKGQSVTLTLSPSPPSAVRTPTCHWIGGLLSRSLTQLHLTRPFSQRRSHCRSPGLDGRSFGGSVGWPVAVGDRADLHRTRAQLPVTARGGGLRGPAEPAVGAGTRGGRGPEQKQLELSGGRSRAGDKVRQGWVCPGEERTGLHPRSSSCGSDLHSARMICMGHFASAPSWLGA